MGFTGFALATAALAFAILTWVFPSTLAWLDWFIAPFALLTFVLSTAGVARDAGRRFGIAGAVLSLVALPLAVVRLVLSL